MKFAALALSALLSVSVFATTVTQDFGVTYSGFLGKDGTYRTVFKFNVPGNPDLNYLFSNFFYNEDFQTQIEKRVKDVTFTDLGNGNVEATNKICALGMCKDIVSQCTTTETADSLTRNCQLDFTKGDAADVLSSEGRFGSINEVSCSNATGEVACTFTVTGKTKAILINSALKIAKETITGTYKNIASVLTGLENTGATYPLEIKNAEMKALKKTLNQSTDKDF